MASSRYLKWSAAACVAVVVLLVGAAGMTELGHVFGIPESAGWAYNLLGVPAGIAAMVAAFLVWDTLDDRR